MSPTPAAAADIGQALHGYLGDLSTMLIELAITVLAAVAALLVNWRLVEQWLAAKRSAKEAGTSPAAAAAPHPPATR